MKHHYTYLITWLALIAIICASIILLIHSLNSGISRIGIVVAIICWIVLTSSALFLFLRASKLTVNMMQDEEDPSPVKTDTDSKKARKIDTLDIQSVARKISRRAKPNTPPPDMGKQLLEICVKELEIMTGIFYYLNNKGVFTPEASYANPNPGVPFSFIAGEGLTGQAAKSKQVTVLKKIPDDYSDVFSGLGRTRPSYLAIMPLVVNDKTIAVLEVAGFRWADQQLEQLFQMISREISKTAEQMNADMTSKNTDQ